MKTIVINGLTFTDQPPTKEGWWLFAVNDTELAVEQVYTQDGKLVFWHFGQVEVIIPKGFWHELIPRGVFAKEVERAYREGHYYGGWDAENGADSIKTDWPESRAKLVAEGKEPTK